MRPPLLTTHIMRQSVRIMSTDSLRTSLRMDAPWLHVANDRARPYDVQGARMRAVLRAELIARGDRQARRPGLCAR